MASDGIFIRPAGPDDEARLLAWRNDPLTCGMSLSQAGVRPEEHRDWFQRVLRDPERCIFIGEVGNEPVGMVRLDSMPDGRVWMSIAMAPEWRGKGLGAALLTDSIDTFVQGKATPLEFVAEILPDNAASIRSFAKSGFFFLRKETSSNTAEKFVYVKRIL